MADSTIAQLPSALALTASDYFPVDQGGVTKKATLSLLGNGSVFVTSGKSLYVTNTLTFIGTDGTSITFPTTDATIARTDTGQTFTGTQVFGALTCTTINGGTIAFVAGKTFTINNTITIVGTDGTTITFPTTSATMARTDAAQTFTGTQTFSSSIVGSVTGSAATLTTPRTIDGVSFDGSANILVVAPAIHAATNKATPVDADEFGIWDSVGSTLNHVTWANIKTTLGATFAALAGSASQVFSIGYPTSSSHAARLEQVSLFVEVTAVAAPDIFGAVGSTINYNNSTPVTMTSIAACASAQVGLVKKLIPSANVTVTASANLVVDGATSGNFILPANADIEVRPESTTKFIITTISAWGDWTIDYSGTGGTCTHTSYGRWEKTGRKVTLHFTSTFSANTLTGGITISGFPFTSSAITIYCAGYISSFSNLSTALTDMSILVSPGSTTGQIYVIAAAATSKSLMQGTDLSATTVLAGNIVYFV